MVITYYGLGCFRAQSRDVIVAIDPYGKDTGFTPPRYEAQIIVKTDPFDTSVNYISGSPLVCATPGEYEAHDILLTGIDAQSATPFIIEAEGMRVAHMGQISDKNIFNNISEYFEKIDVCMVSVGGKDLSSAEGAVWLANQIEPRIVVPMNYAITGLKAKLGKVDMFLKEIKEKPEKADRLSIKKNSLPQGEQKVVIISPQGR